MATPPILDFDTLLAPIPGDNPAGGSVPFTIKEQLEESRKEENPDEYSEKDPRRPDQVKRADWPGIIKLAQKTLVETSKDLLTSARLTEALTNVNGFAGLRDGLQLMRRLLDECWDRINPPIEEEGDLEIRAGPFNWLDDPDRGARFPNTVRAVPLVFGKEAAYSQRDWKMAQEGKGDVKLADFEKAVDEMSLGDSQTIFEDIEGAVTEMQELVKVLDAKFADVAPGLTSLRQSTLECYQIIKQLYDRKKAEAPPEEEELAEGEGPTGDGAAATGAAPRAAATNREEIYRQLRQSAAMLQKIEPHSPIPYLIMRAVELGTLQFPDLIKQLVRDDNIIAELNREFGIKEPEE